MHQRTVIILVLPCRRPLLAPCDGRYVGVPEDELVLFPVSWAFNAILEATLTARSAEVALELGVSVSVP
jgi:hypothetical protein